MVVDSKGAVYFDEFGTNKLASIDPVTMEIREYVLPDAAARPRRIAITSDDVIWYSDYASGHLGRLDPKTGKATEWPSPGGPKSRPYGITIVGNVIWYSESGTRPNTVVRFDPTTEKFQTWVDSLRRRRRAQHGAHAGRQPLARLQRRQWHCRSRNKSSAEKQRQARRLLESAWQYRFFVRVCL